MARPRTITDEQLLVAAEQVALLRGPNFTIADVAAQAGVSVGSVAQRFGSRTGLLVALSRRATQALAHRMRAAADAAGDPVAALTDALVAWLAPLDDSEHAANHLAMLATDLVEPQLRALLGELYSTVQDELDRLLRSAAGVLPGAPAQAARVLLVLAHGTAFDWSVRPTGSLVARLRQDVSALLAGWQQVSPAPAPPAAAPPVAAPPVAGTAASTPPTARASE